MSEEHGVPASRMPSALVILSAVIVLASIATWILPQGEYRREERRFPRFERHLVAAGETLEGLRETTGTEATSLAELRDAETGRPLEALVAGREILVPVGGMVRSAVVPGTYAAIPDAEVPPLGERLGATFGNAAVAPIVGFTRRAQIIGFVLIIGGAFGVILATGAIDRGLRSAVERLGRGRLRLLVIPVSMTLFSFGGAVFGLGESTIAFVLVTIPLAIRLGWDSLTGIAMCYLASQIGFAGAFFNPFTIGIAQSIAELPYPSGFAFRVVAWVAVTAIGVAFVQLWASRVAKDPRRSPTFALDEVWRRRLAAEADAPATRLDLRESLVVAVAFLTIFASGAGVAWLDWYIDEMAGLFLAAALVCGALGRFGPNRVAAEFTRGAASMAEPALVIAASAGVLFVLEDGRVLDTILVGLAAPLERLPAELGAVAMMMVQALVNFFVPSGSGQAAMTMPVVTPLCDIIGLRRQVGVLAFQFGDGFGNTVIPTSAVLMGVLGAARVPWTSWVRWVWPLVLALHLAAAAFLVLAIHGPESWMR